MLFVYNARIIYSELWMVEDGKALNGVLTRPNKRRMQEVIEATK